MRISSHILRICILSLAFLAQSGVLASSDTQIHNGRLPQHTVFWAKGHQYIVFATGGYFASKPSSPSVLSVLNTATHIVRSVPASLPEAIAFSQDGTKIIENSTFESDIRCISSLQILKRLPHSSYAWWVGNKFNYLNTSEGYLYAQGRRHPARVGRSDLVAVSAGGHYFLSVRQVRKGTVANGDDPTQQVGLWQSLPNSRFRFLHTLAIVNFDRFEGDPRHLAVLNGNILVFGIPVGGALGYDYLCIFRKGHKMRYIKDGQGSLLRFDPQAPIVTGNAIIGLASDAMQSSHYLYCVTATGFFLRPVASNVRFVVYDPVLGVGLGVSRDDKTSINYDKLSVTAAIR